MHAWEKSSSQVKDKSGSFGMSIGMNKGSKAREQVF